MMNKEQLDEIKSRVSIIGKYKEFDKAVSAMILTKDVPTTVAEVERLREALEIIATDISLSHADIMRLAEKTLKGANDDE